MLTAIVKLPAPSLLVACELTFIDRSPMNFDLLQAQHLEYRQALELAGAKVLVLEASADLADSVFVEDAAVVLDELAIITRPGSASRLPEPIHLEPVLSQYRKLERIQAPGTLEGGDVLRIGQTLFVGITTRTNLEGIRQLEGFVQAFGYTVVPVECKGSLHLKTACTALNANTVLLNPDWLDFGPFKNFKLVFVPKDEPFGANVLPIGSSLTNSSLIANAAFPKSLELIHNHARHARVIPVNISEFGKAEAGLTCMNLVFSA